MKATLPEGKKRYYLSLTEERVKQLQVIIKELGMPKTMLSLLMDMSLQTLIPSLQAVLDAAKSGRDMTQAEFTAMILNTAAAAHIASDREFPEKD